MPEMTSPDGSETLTVPDDGVRTMRTLGWSEAKRSKRTEPEAESEPEPESEERPRRGPGRPRKHRE